MALKISQQMNITEKDLPKVQGMPKPEQAMLWTVYVLDGQLRARVHPANDFTKAWLDAAMQNPENFCDAVDTYRGRR